MHIKLYGTRNNQEAIDYLTEAAVRWGSEEEYTFLRDHTNIRCQVDIYIRQENGGPQERPGFDEDIRNVYYQDINQNERKTNYEEDAVVFSCIETGGNIMLEQFVPQPEYNHTIEEMDWRMQQVMFCAYLPQHENIRGDLLALTNTYKRLLTHLTTRFWDNFFSSNMEPNLLTRDEILWHKVYKHHMINGSNDKLLNR